MAEAAKVWGSVMRLRGRVLRESEVEHRAWVVCLVRL